MERIDLKALRVSDPALAAWIEEAEDLIKQMYWGTGLTLDHYPRLDALLKAIEVME